MSATYYFTGDCTDSAVQEKIKEKFIITLSTSAYRDACLVHAKECKAENVQVCNHKPRKLCYTKGFFNNIGYTSIILF